MQNYWLNLRHLPAFFLVVGYPLYWFELYFSNKGDGCTSSAAWGIVFLFACFNLYHLRNAIPSHLSEFLLKMRGLNFFDKLFIGMAGILSLVIIGITLYAALLPPHLLQEFDALNYHITLPRQHLLWRTFAHIPWSSGDLFLIPIDFALAPFWFSTNLPNKFPQYFFAVGLLTVVFSLGKRLASQDSGLIPLIIVFSVLSLHMMGIQWGTAMLDIVACYLFFAVIDSLIAGHYALAAVEFVFFFWSKAFVPFQIVLIVGAAVFFIAFFKIFGFQNDSSPLWQNCVKIDWRKGAKVFIVWFFVLSAVVAGPFLVKSFYYSGTPVYPLFANSARAHESVRDKEPYKTLLKEAAAIHLEPKDYYGHGRSFFDFLKHLWLLGVPERGPNNAFDYPAGLTYLIYIGPFIYLFLRGLWTHKINPISLFVVLYWMAWWFGSQQARFLYIPVILIIFVVLTEIPLTRVFKGAILFALALMTLSVFGASKQDLFVSDRQEVLRSIDKNIISMNTIYLEKGNKEIVVTENWDVAFARFPVMVVNKALPWSLGKSF